MTLRSAPIVAVTGGRGRLGRLVVEDLRARGLRTISLSRGAAGDHTDDLGVDLTDFEAVRKLMTDRPVDTIVHLAAAVHQPDAVPLNARIDASLDAIVCGSMVRSVVFASTSAVYGVDSPTALTESSPALGTSPYAVSKLATEARLRSLAAQNPGLSVTALRIFNIAGPDFPDSLVQRLLVADPEHPARLIDPDSFVRDYIHQADVVRAIRAAIDRGQPGFEIINVGAGAPVTTRALLRSLGVDDHAWIEVPGAKSASWCNNSAMIRAFGFAPRAMPTRAWDRPVLA